MKICISSTGKNLSSIVDTRFGRCAYFLIVDSDKVKELKIIKNTGVQAQHGAGITASQIVVDQKVDVVISGNFGPKASLVLSQAGVKCYIVPSSMSIKEALKSLNQGELQELLKPSAPHYS